MATKYIKYRVNASALRVRKQPSVKSEFVGYVKKGDIINAVYGSGVTADGYRWYKIKYKGGYYWLSNKYLVKVNTKNYRQLVVEKAKLVYGIVVKYKCKHKSGAKTLEQIKSKRVTTCATSVSVALQEAGVLRKGKLISHTKKVGSSVAVKRKNTIKKAISGYGNLIKGRYNTYRIGKTWKNVPKKYKVAGAVVVYDSNIAIYGGGFFYTANNGSSQKDKNKRYKKVTAKSGYCYSSPVLYIIIPKTK